MNESFAYKLTLYITGNGQHSQRAASNLKSFCEARLQGQYVLDVVDLLEHPYRAQREGIVVTPVLVKTEPSPCSRMVGDFSDTEAVERALGVAPDEF